LCKSAWQYDSVTCTKDVDVLSHNSKSEDYEIDVYLDWLNSIYEYDKLVTQNKDEGFAWVNSIYEYDQIVMHNKFEAECSLNKIIDIVMREYHSTLVSISTNNQRKLMFQYWSSKAVVDHVRLSQLLLFTHKQIEPAIETKVGHKLTAETSAAI
jgi:hypothetical protein